MSLVSSHHFVLLVKVRFIYIANLFNCEYRVVVTQQLGRRSSEGSGSYLKLDFQVHGISQKIGLRQVEQGFSSFFAKFLAYLTIFQSGAY